MRTRTTPLFTLLAVVAVAVAYRTSVGFGFLSDAHFLIEHNRFLADPGTWWGQITHDYFWSSSGNTIPYWRPFTKLSWLVEAQVFGPWPGGYHLVQLAWHLLGVAGVSVLARRLSASSLWAAGAGLLYGLSAVAVEPTCLLMARSDVVSATAMVWAVVCWLGWRESGDTRSAVAHALWLGVAVMSKESAVVLAPVLSVWAFLLPDASRSRASDVLRASGPSWVWVIAFLGIRAAVLAGEGAPSIQLDPLRVFVGGGQALAALLPLRLSTGIRNVSYEEASGLWVLGSAAFSWAVFGGLAAWCVRARDFRSVAVLVWIAAAIAPVLLVEQIHVPNVEDKFPMADRWLLPAVAGVSSIVAVWVSAIPGMWIQRVAAGSCVLWALGAVWIGPQTHAYYASDATLLERDTERYKAIPEAYRTKQDRCRAMDRELDKLRGAGEAAGALALARVAQERCGSSLGRRVSELTALIHLEAFAEGRAVAEDLLRSLDARNERFDTRLVPTIHYRHGQALANTGAPREARAALRLALDQGLRSCGVFASLAFAATRLNDPEQAARDYEQAFSCEQGGGRDAPVHYLVWAKEAWDAAKRPEEVARVEEWIRSVTTR